jgi:hypothetical protein
VAKPSLRDASIISTNSFAVVQSLFVLGLPRTTLPRTVPARTGSDAIFEVDNHDILLINEPKILP